MALFMFMRSSSYSLRKSRHVMRWGYSWYKKKGKILSSSELSQMESLLASLDEALLQKDHMQANALAHKVEEFCNARFKKSYFDYASELFIAIVLALAIATLVRQVWFELYEIPTGSMRPTFKEQDHLTVTKTAFGINFPLQTKHLYFDPDLIQRTSIVIFSGDGLPLLDTDSTYFWLLPYTKRYVKRLIAKPGDSLYFYGGKIYGVDKNGDPIPELLNSPWLEKIEHIPFISFDGTVSSPNQNQIVFHMMQQPIGRLTFSNYGNAVGEIHVGDKWVQEKPFEESSTQINNYSDFLGIRNYAMARLLTKQQVRDLTSLDPANLDEGVLYLELRHSPNLTNPKPTLLQEGSRVSIMLTPFSTVIPLQQKHLDALMDNMYTARFIVSDGRAKRYSVTDIPFGMGSPSFPAVPNGSYEFYYGKAHKVGWGGITSLLPKSSPLYRTDPANVQKLFNLGIDVDRAYEPYSKNQPYYPHRYAYFRNGDLYILGAPIMTKDDPILASFLKNEQKRQNNSNTSNPYIAFKDYGPPLKDGHLNADFIRTFGITVPDGKYLALGDNHAMSADSRIFGFVPAANLQGAPSLIIWPPGDRWGPPAQKTYPIFVLPRLIIWSIAAAIVLIWYAIHRRNVKRPIFKKLTFAQTS